MTKKIIAVATGLATATVGGLLLKRHRTKRAAQKAQATAGQVAQAVSDAITGE